MIVLNCIVLFCTVLYGRALSDWTIVVGAAVEAEHSKVVSKQNRAPLAEIEFWRDRATGLSALYEQINMPKVLQMIQASALLLLCTLHSLCPVLPRSWRTS